MKKIFKSSRIKLRLAAHKGDAAVRLIAVFKLVKAIVLLALGLGIAAMLHKGTADYMEHWATLLSVRQENRYVRHLLAWLMGVKRRDLRFFEVSTFIYSALVWTEGIGLLLLKRWAEYLTVIITASFIPLKLYTEIKHFNA